MNRNEFATKLMYETDEDEDTIKNILRKLMGMSDEEFEQMVEEESEDN